MIGFVLTQGGDTIFLKLLDKYKKMSPEVKSEGILEFWLETTVLHTTDTH